MHVTYVDACWGISVRERIIIIIMILMKKIWKQKKKHSIELGSLLSGAGRARTTH